MLRKYLYKDTYKKKFNENWKVGCLYTEQAVAEIS